VLVNLAVSGSIAEGVNIKKTFDGQVDAWIRDHKARGVPDRTVVYFGYNDLKADKSLSNAKNQYRAQVDRLIANGVTQGQRRLVLCLLHDWSRNPGATRSYRSRVTEWNRHVRNVAAARPNCAVVDLFSLFERVFANPGKHGLKNVSTPSTAASRSTHLFYDSLHFGARGQAIIARAMKTALERAAAGRATRLAELGPERPVPTLAALEPPSASPAAWPCFAHPIGATPP
jgi:lysophospholipase L1-like esterase